MILSPSEIKNIIDNSPTLPGIYKMISKKDIIYIGKAKNLQNRIKSYFQKSLDNKTLVMISQVDSIEWMVTKSDLEALLLESNLIKDLMPKYNILFKDDKSYPYLVISNHKFPRIYFKRSKIQDKHNKYFGPYPSLSSLKSTLQLLHKIFPVRQCSNTEFSNRSRPCLQYQMNRCSAPCVGYISEYNYADDVNVLENFLLGKDKQTLEYLKDQMSNYSNNEDYEQAAIIRDRIIALNSLQSSQQIHSPNNHDQHSDVLGIAKDKGYFCIFVINVRNGKVIGNNSFSDQYKLDESRSYLLERFIMQYYLDTNVIPPTEVILADNITISHDVLREISSYHKRKINWLFKPRSTKRDWQKLADKNAKLKVDSIFTSIESHHKRLENLKEIFKLNNIPSHIECFDISHLYGKNTVSACVVMGLDGIKKSEYKKFNIEGIQSADDCAAIKSAVYRRYRNSSKIPDMIVIDGGKGQLKSALESLQEIGIADNTKLISISKGPERISGEEDIWESLDQVLPRKLDKDNLGFLALRQIRDEAHRFSIQSQRKRSRKNMLVSDLDNIKGIGIIRKKSLISHFGSIANIKSASADDIAKIPGISISKAQEILSTL